MLLRLSYSPEDIDDTDDGKNQAAEEEYVLCDIGSEEARAPSRYYRAEVRAQVLSAGCKRDGERNGVWLYRHCRRGHYKGHDDGDAASVDEGAHIGQADAICESDEEEGDYAEHAAERQRVIFKSAVNLAVNKTGKEAAQSEEKCRVSGLRGSAYSVILHEEREELREYHAGKEEKCKCDSPADCAARELYLFG